VAGSNFCDLGPVNKIVKVCEDLSEAPIIGDETGYSIYPEAVLLSLISDRGSQGEEEGVLPELLQRIEQRMNLSGVQVFIYAVLQHSRKDRNMFTVRHLKAKTTSF
jgi:hypothetical protein